jgi:hypothetical protein
MQISEAAQVLEVFNQENANKCLAEGWRLLAVLPAAPKGSSSETSVIYVLGKPAQPVVPKGEYVDGRWVPADE